MKIVAFSIVSLVMGVAMMAASGPDVRRYAFDSDVASVRFDTAAVKAGIELSCVSTSRSRFMTNRPLAWSLRWNHRSGNYDFLRIHESRYSIGESYSVVAGRFSSGKETIMDSICVNRPIGRYPDATWTYLYWADRRLNVYTGTTELKAIMSVDADVPEGECSLRGDGVAFESVVVETWKDLSRSLMTSHTEESIRERATLTGEGLEGIWEYFDRDTEEDMARLGGRYRLGIVREDDGSFSIVYLGGAVVNSDIWRPGMKKGRLVSTPFKGQYTLQWFDSAMDIVENDADSYATLENESLITLAFPLYQASFRIVRVN